MFLRRLQRRGVFVFGTTEESWCNFEKKARMQENCDAGPLKQLLRVRAFVRGRLYQRQRREG